MSCFCYFISILSLFYICIYAYVFMYIIYKLYYIFINIHVTFFKGLVKINVKNMSSVYSEGNIDNIWLSTCQLKKDVQLESCELFYLGQNKDCGPGGSITDRSERLLQKGSQGKSIYKVLVKEFNTRKHSIYKRFLLVMRVWCHHEGV